MTLNSNSNDYLEADVHAAFENCKADDCPFNRRTYVRTVFATLEAATFGLKRRILDPRHGVTLDPADLALLNEETYGLDNKCEPHTQPKFLPTDVNFRYTIGTFARVFDLDVSVDAGGGDWQAFRDAVRIRNRITHPKDQQSYDLTDQEMGVVLQAYEWASGLVVRCHTKLLQKMKAMYGDLPETNS